MSRVLSVLVLALLLPGCLRVGEEVDMQAIWDLRTTRDIEAVGWPGDMGSAFEATTGQGLEKILLAGDVVVQGDFRVNPARDGGLYGRPYDDQLRSLSITFEPESVGEVMDRARAYADELDLALGDLPRWAMANSDGQDTSPGGATALSGTATLPDGAEVQLATRAFPDGDALLRLVVVWPREEDA